MNKIFCKELNKEFDNKEDMFKALAENIDSIIAVKKSVPKQADGLNIGYGIVTPQGTGNADVVVKAGEIPDDAKEIKVTAIINTTNYLDSHGDVHINGLWKKSLSEAKNILHLQEHKNSFATIIADGQDVKAKSELINWRDLGFDYDGQTDALTFYSTVKSERNSYMFKQYKNGYVRNHSVGMQYVKMLFCANTNEPEMAQYKENWDKYSPMVVNTTELENRQYFYAVTEAKVIEGSAVPLGSNTATPTLDVSAKENINTDASNSTKDIEPSTDTQTQAVQTLETETPKNAVKASINYSEITNILNKKTI